MPDDAPHEKTLIKVIVFSTAISFGILGAVIASMNGFFRGEVSFHFGFGSILGFILGFAAGWLFWKIVFWRRKKTDSSQAS